ncbi:pantetheine-phosphate adenylyltransferase [Carnobacteriaceae bacterium zg-ZUI252]|nr:pantetheine-phosphate adenylyltransferase [Carnobacteriaceae bacterium zg-ZUI252]QTU83542.1 pantetheine-phosphate adenylyltransferase [Carnobacteriaceae bacterium zg-C25]
MNKKALFTGSFDPFTKGHLDIVERALRLFDEVVIAVSYNEHKQSLFTPQERCDLIKQSIAHLKNVSVVIHQKGLSVALADKLGCCVMIKGARNGSDFDYEQSKIYYGQLAFPHIETVIFSTNHDLTFVSSSGIKEFFRLNGDVSHMVDEHVKLALSEKLEKESVTFTHVGN